MSDAPVSVRERKFIRNPLLSRKQFILEVMHPGKANLSKAELQAQVAKVSASLSSHYSTLLFARGPRPCTYLRHVGT